MQSFHCTRGTHKKVWRPYSPWDLPQYERQQPDLNKRKWSVSVFSVYLWSFSTGTRLVFGRRDPLLCTDAKAINVVPLLPSLHLHHLMDLQSPPDTGCGSDLRRRPQFHRACFTSVQPRSRCRASALLFLAYLGNRQSERQRQKKCAALFFFFSRHQLNKLLLFPLRVLRFIGSGVMRSKCW